MASDPGKLSEAELYAPDLDEGKRDVEYYTLPDASGINDHYLREVWEEVRAQFPGGIASPDDPAV